MTMKDQCHSDFKAPILDEEILFDGNSHHMATAQL